MTTATPASAAQPSLDWDLTDLYAGFDDPRLAADMETLRRRAAEFRARYYGRLAELAEEPARLAEAIRELEAIEALAGRIVAFPHLRFAANTRDEEASAWTDKVDEAVTEASNDLLFFSLQLQALPEERFAALQAAPELSGYRHYLDRLAQERPHRLSEEVERVLNEQALTGRDAWVKLHELREGSLRYQPVRTPEGTVARTEAELSALLHHADAGVRYAAYRSVRQALRRENRLFAYILNAIAQDHRLDARRRGYAGTLQAQLESVDEIPEAVFRALMEATARRFGLFQEYYRLKGQALGMRPRTCDIYAPWPDAAPGQELSYVEGQRTLAEALDRFSSEYAALAVGFFARNWVDARVRPGKRGGAFCWPVYGLHSYLLMSWTSDDESLFTLAHELGHGLHYELLAQRQTLLNANPPMLLAELASIFNELLLLDHLLEVERDPARRRRLLTRNIEDLLNLLFRQSTISRLELAIHERVSAGPLDAAFVNETWEQLYRDLCGDAVELLPEHRVDWARIGHIFFKPFYCYNYSLSAVAALACYRRYKQDGAAFVPRYLELLRSGSSRSPVETLALVDIDLADPATIEDALGYVATLLDELRALVAR
jgi:oligoendopeptidase F